MSQEPSDFSLVPQDLREEKNNPIHPFILWAEPLVLTE